MDKAAILGVVRHILTFGGGFLVSSNYLDPASVETAVGAVITLAGIVWSVIEKRKAPAA